MKRTVLSFLMIVCVFTLLAKQQPTNLKCEYLAYPEGIDMQDPCFYWQLESGEQGQFQTTYQILVATSQEKLDQNTGYAVTGIEMGMGNYDLAASMTKFIRDIFDGQNPETGGLSVITPDSKYVFGMSPLWGSAAVQLPYYMCNYYGDTRIIEQYWDKMMLFAESVWNLNQDKDKPGLFNDVLSDWSSVFGNRPGKGEGVYVSMNFLQVLTRMMEMAKVIGKTADLKSLQQKADVVKEVVYSNFFNNKLHHYSSHCLGANRITFKADEYCC